MQIKDIANKLLEVGDERYSKTRGYADKLLLRLVRTPNLLAFLSDLRVIDEETIELTFISLPDEAFQEVRKLCPGVDVETYRFKKDEFHPMVGYRLKIRS